jgi:MFS family permease
MIGLVSGLGEFIGYALRLLAGYIADRTRVYWVGTFIGYGLLISIPLLALANRWEMAALLLILERVGKAVRTPSRDAILSHATQQIGRGWGFALHEALDQIGAMIGPLILTAVFLLKGDYRSGFSVLWIPVLLTLLALTVAWRRVPSPESLEVAADPEAKRASNDGKLGFAFWAYAAFTFLSVAGFAGFPLISYHLVVQGVVPQSQIAILYAVAMGVDAGVALLAGKAYDRVGLVSLAIIPLLTVAIPLLAFSAGYGLVLGGIILWGMVMAVHETTMRAAIADLSASERRGLAYGVFNTVYGAAWFVGNVAIGWLYGLSPALILAYVAAMEVMAVAVFLLARRTWGATNRMQVRHRGSR